MSERDRRKGIQKAEDEKFVILLLLLQNRLRFFFFFSRFFISFPERFFFIKIFLFVLADIRHNGKYS